MRHGVYGNSTTDSSISTTTDNLPQSQAPNMYSSSTHEGGGPSTYGGGDSNPGNDNGSNGAGNNGGPSGSDNGKDNENRRAPFTMHGVLHYLQHEWSRYELERAQWEMERAELRARISFLVGERKGQENLKHDLVRRIKMLEYSLRQERAKVHRLMHNGQDPEQDELDNEFNPGADSTVPMDIDALEKNLTGGQKNAANNSQAWREARQVLRQYLQEIGYSEKILDVRSFRVKNLLGLLPDNWNLNGDGRKAAEKALLDTEQAVLDTAEIIKQSRKYDNFEGVNNKSNDLLGEDDSDSDNDSIDSSKQGGHLDRDAVEALDEFSFLKDEKSSTTGGQTKSNKWHYDQSSLENVKEEFRHRMEDRKKSQDKAPKKGDSPSSQQYPKPHHPPPTHPQFGDEVDAGIGAGVGLHVAEGLTGKDLDVDVALGISPADEGPVDTKDDFGGLVDDDQLLANQQRWSIRFTLRSHYDSIRAMQFHPLQPVLITASEDGTAKLWDLNAAGSGTGTIKGEGVSKSQIPQPTTGIVDVEPIYTFRGHKGPILAMDMSPTGDMCYTSGFDGSICCWVVPSTAIEIYQNYDPTVLQERLLGHTDAVWAVTYHSSTNRLISASADGTIRLWEPGVGEGMGQSLLRTFTPPAPNSRPRSIDIVSTETQQLLTAYSKANCGILDLETGQNVLTFDFQEGEDGGVGEINKILSHPTMPVTVMAGEDRKIRYFDNNTGKLIHGTVAHVESIGTLAIDPNGLYLLSGSHDGSLRLWNMEKRICLQEIAAHRKKYDMSVMAVAFHPSRPLIGSAGADSLAKVFATSKPSPPFSSPTSSVTSTTSPTSTTTTSYVKSSIAE